MAATTNLEIVTPSMVIVSEPAEMVVIPGADGDIGALPRHSNLMSTLHRLSLIHISEPTRPY